MPDPLQTHKACAPSMRKGIRTSSEIIPTLLTIVDPPHGRRLHGVLLEFLILTAIGQTPNLPALATPNLLYDVMVPRYSGTPAATAGASGGSGGSDVAGCWSGDKPDGDANPRATVMGKLMGPVGGAAAGTPTSATATAGAPAASHLLPSTNTNLLSLSAMLPNSLNLLASMVPSLPPNFSSNSMPLSELSPFHRVVGSLPPGSRGLSTSTAADPVPGEDAGCATPATPAAPTTTVSEGTITLSESSDSPSKPTGTANTGAIPTSSGDRGTKRTLIDIKPLAPELKQAKQAKQSISEVFARVRSQQAPVAPPPATSEPLHTDKRALSGAASKWVATFSEFVAFVEQRRAQGSEAPLPRTGALGTWCFEHLAAAQQRLSAGGVPVEDGPSVCLSRTAYDVLMHVPEFRVEVRKNESASFDECLWKLNRFVQANGRQPLPHVAAEGGTAVDGSEAELAEWSACQKRQALRLAAGHPGAGAMSRDRIARLLDISGWIDA
jgi:hypothetical protein